MNKGYCEKSELTAIAEAIRGKTGKTDTMALSEMPSEITNIQTSLPTQEKSVSITANGSKEVTADDGYALSKVDISVAVPQDNDNNAKFDWSLYKNKSSSEFNIYKAITSIDFSGIDTSTTSNMQYLFSDFEALTSLDLSNFDTSKVSKMDNMFLRCASLQEIIFPKNFASSASSFDNMFAGCSALTSLDLSNFNTANAYSLGAMFSGCKSLTEIDISGFDASNITSIRFMFSGCNNIKTIKLFPSLAGKLCEINGLFMQCEELTSIDLSALDTTNVSNMSNMFYATEKLSNLILSENWGINSSIYSIDLGGAPLTYDSCLDVFNKLADKTQTETTSATLRLSSATKALMSEDEIKIATDKGWTIS